jgi:hypothetical protein
VIFLEIGAGLVGFGGVFLVLGILLFFDTAMLALGNLLFLLGITLLIGARQALVFFGRRAKIRGTICFFSGILLVLFKYPIIGMLLEGFGILNLFGNFFPIVIQIFRNMPIIGPALAYPPVATIVDKLVGATLPTSSRP